MWGFPSSEDQPLQCVCLTGDRLMKPSAGWTFPLRYLSVSNQPVMFCISAPSSCQGTAFHSSEDLPLLFDSRLKLVVIFLSYFFEIIFKAVRTSLTVSTFQNNRVRSICGKRQSSRAFFVLSFTYWSSSRRTSGFRTKNTGDAGRRLHLTLLFWN